MSKTTTRTITQDFEERELKFEGRTVYCWFTAKAQITTEIEGDGIDYEITSESKIDWVDVSDCEFAESLEHANEGEYSDATPSILKALERDLEVEEFRF
jgi:hypothetical protein